MFQRTLNLLALTRLLMFFLKTEKSLAIVNPVHMEFYLNYGNHPEDNKSNYKFNYFIDHQPSNVHMMHVEERQGDEVKGQYGLLEPNGMVRMVHYQVVGGSGFQSVVQTRTAHSTTHMRLAQRNQPKLPLVLQQPVATFT